MKFAIAPDSTLRAQMADVHGRFARVVPWVWLIWLVWLFGPVLFQVRDFPHWLAPTLLSLPVFLVLYVRAHLCPHRHVIWYALAIAALGGALTPFNPWGETYLIYACAVAADWGSIRKSGALVLAMLAAYSVCWLWLGFPWGSLIFVWVFCPILAGIGLTNRMQRMHRADLRLSMDEVRRLAASTERERIGRDLHDLLGHTLSMVALKSELARRLVERDPHAAQCEIAEVERVARDALAQVRSAVSGIRAAALASEFASARLLLESAGVRMEYWSDGKELPPDVETCLAMVLREAVTNIQRHARASGVEVSVIAGDRRVVMRIRDDGRGGVNDRGNGLTGMRERVTALGGEIWIDSPQGKGTALEVRLPLPPVTTTADHAVQKVVPISAAAPAQRVGSHA